MCKWMMQCINVFSWFKNWRKNLAHIRNKIFRDFKSFHSVILEVLSFFGYQFFKKTLHCLIYVSYPQKSFLQSCVKRVNHLWRISRFFMDTQFFQRQVGENDALSFILCLQKYFIQITSKCFFKGDWFMIMKKSRFMLIVMIGLWIGTVVQPMRIHAAGLSDD